jgi:NTE family protein
MKALVLGGGAARGFAHIGVLRQLEAKGCSFDIITGNSMGGLIGAFIADGRSSDDLTSILKDVSWPSLLSFPGRGFFQTGDAVIAVLEKHFSNRTIESLKTPFACIAADIDTGEEVVLDSGPIIDAVRATVSIPGIFKPHEYSGRFLVDGGLVNNLPILLAENMGATSILAINVRRKKDRPAEISTYLRSHKAPLAKLFSHFGPSLFYDALEKSYDILAGTLDEQQMAIGEGTELTVVNVDLDTIKYRDFLKWEQILKRGTNADLSEYIL